MNYSWRWNEIVLCSYVIWWIEYISGEWWTETNWIKRDMEEDCWTIKKMRIHNRQMICWLYTLLILVKITMRYTLIINKLMAHGSWLLASVKVYNWWTTKMETDIKKKKKTKRFHWTMNNSTRNGSSHFIIIYVSMTSSFRFGFSSLPSICPKCILKMCAMIIRFEYLAFCRAWVF